MQPLRIAPASRIAFNMKIHVHLGVHKTATTFIQSQLHDSRSLLAEGQIGFAGIWSVRKQFTNAFDRLSWFDPVWWKLTRPRLARKLNAILSHHKKAQTFILSDENLLGLIAGNYWFGRLYPAAGGRVRILDSLLAGHDVRYFLCIRRYPDYLTSSWLQLATRGKAPPFEKYRAKFGPEKRGWSEVVADVARACGRERLTVWTYDWFNANPARVFELLAPGVHFAVPEGDLRRDVLPSLTLKGLKVITQLENHLSDGELKQLSRLIRTFPFDEPNPRLEITDAAVLAAYEDKYQADLDKIRALGVDLHVE
jgi:hypothetical protein